MNISTYKFVFLERIKNTKASNTYRNYSQVLNAFPNALTPETIDHFVSQCRSDGISQNTLVLKLAVVKQLLLFIQRREDIKYYQEMLELCTSVKHKDVLQTYAMESQVKTMLQHEKSPMHKTILMLLYYQAMRVSEVVNLTPSDITEDGIIIRDSKNGNDAVVPYLSKCVKKSIEEHMIRYRPQQYLFEIKGKQMTTNTIQSHVRRHSELLGFNLTCHSFRRGCLTSALDKGLDIHTVSKLIARHSNIQTTAKSYLAVSKEAIQKSKNIFDK